MHVYCSSMTAILTVCHVNEGFACPANQRQTQTHTRRFFVLIFGLWNFLKLLKRKSVQFLRRAACRWLQPVWHHMLRPIERCAYWAAIWRLDKKIWIVQWLPLSNFIRQNRSMLVERSTNVHRANNFEIFNKTQSTIGSTVTFFCRNYLKIRKTLYRRISCCHLVNKCEIFARRKV